MGVGVDSGVGTGVEVGVSLDVGMGDGIGVDLEVGGGVGLGVDVGVGSGVGVGVGTGVETCGSVTAGVGVEAGDGVAVTPWTGVEVVEMVGLAAVDGETSADSSSAGVAWGALQAMRNSSAMCSAETSMGRINIIAVTNVTDCK